MVITPLYSRRQRVSRRNSAKEAHVAGVIVQPNLPFDLWSLARARMRHSFLAFQMLSLAAGEFQIRPNVGG